MPDSDKLTDEREWTLLIGPAGIGVIPGEHPGYEGVERVVVVPKSARGSVTLPNEVEADPWARANWLEARLASLETETRRVVTSLKDIVKFAKADGCTGRVLSVATVALDRLDAALSAASSTGEDEEAAVERVAEALSACTMPTRITPTNRHDFARAAIAAYRGVGDKGETG